MRDPDRVFLDVMRYSESQIPPPDEFTSRQELVNYLEEVNPQMRGRSIPTMVDSRAAEQRLSKQQEQTILTTLRKQKPKIKRRTAQGVKIELSRSNKARLKDESQTKNLLKTNDKNFRRWRKNPERFDLKGIDTKTHTSIKDFIKQKSKPWKQRGIRVVNDRDVHVFVVRKDKRNRLFAQNIITGRRVGKRIYSRFGTLQKLNKR